MSELRQRPGDQALPAEGQEDVFPLVIEDLKTRLALGTARYGQPLQTFNGRDALRDAYEEALDLTVYLRQALAERDKGVCVHGTMPNSTTTLWHESDTTENQ